MIINLTRSMRNITQKADKNNLGHCILLFEAANEIERLQKKLSIAETRLNHPQTRCKITPLSLVKSCPSLNYKRR